jgi:hypothetical protein
MEQTAALEAEAEVDTTSQVIVSTNGRPASFTEDRSRGSRDGLQKIRRVRVSEERDTENQPLLDQGSHEDAEDYNGSESDDEEAEFAHFKGMPWYKRPSVCMPSTPR